MKNKMLLVLVVLALVASTAVFGACKGAPAAPVEKEPLKIGGLFSLTGFAVAFGGESYRAVIVALEEADYQVAGRPIEFIAEDIASDPAVAMDKVRKLVETDKVDVVFGPIFTDACSAVFPYVTKMGVPTMQVTAQPGVIKVPAKWVWQTTGDGPQQTYPMGLYAYEDLGYRTAITIGTDFLPSWKYIEGFTRGFTDSGGRILQQQWCPFGTTDFTPYIINFPDADVLVTWMGENLIPAFLQFKELGVWEKMPIIGASDASITNPDILPELGDAVDGYVTEAHYVRTFDTPWNKEFVEAYQERWGMLPGNYAGCTYATMQVLFEGLRISGGDASPEVLAEALDSVSMDTVRGPVSFNEVRIGQGSAFIVRIDTVEGVNIPTVVAEYTTTSKMVGDELEIRATRKW